ncbi:short chain dehydrogenase [Paenibacillus sp. yr247]|nr:short chain dehydrogenase [Paenibacillus sp. yr247]
MNTLRALARFQKILLIKAAGSKLNNKVAIITGGDSGIGRAVAIAFAKEGAYLVIAYLDGHQDAAET